MMYTIEINGIYHTFDSLLEAEDFIEDLFNRGKITPEEHDNMQIEPYHWTMG